MKRIRLHGAWVPLLAVLLAAPLLAQTPARPSTLEQLRKRAEGAPRLSGSGDTGAVVAVSLLSAGVAAGGVAWALAPHYQNWGPEDPESGTKGHGGTGAAAGVLQSLCQLGVVVAPTFGESGRARNELAAVLDEPDPAARERLAALALRRLDRRARRGVVGGTIAYVALSALSVGAYYAGEAAVGRNPNADRAGPAYVTGQALGAAITGGLVIFGLQAAQSVSSDGRAKE